MPFLRKHVTVYSHVIEGFQPSIALISPLMIAHLAGLHTGTVLFFGGSGVAEEGPFSVNNNRKYKEQI